MRFVVKYTCPTFLQAVNVCAPAPRDSAINFTQRINLNIVNSRATPCAALLHTSRPKAHIAGSIFFQPLSFGRLVGGHIYNRFFEKERTISLARACVRNSFVKNPHILLLASCFLPLVVLIHRLVDLAFYNKFCRSARLVSSLLHKR